ncbi:acyl-CoA dehydrogenase family protein [Saccharopolyspora spinosa]|uniref:Alkylation response protein AidB-like acyl-CoA dehydrogenase n=1 Tax=Saccharopolyspora spinosa TaxID=60894 RepID=A0A2N3Y1L8_SACSN|nr:acyl-CoA dehydrogenase family protein [Saccharopolyspora spinosa]PKW16834.1 alkylation response protein AidB-like acyl-CoA dehydrogenase [Saccharopolyspora spinosa]
MDFRFDADERGLLDQASLAFRKWLPRQRLLDPSPTDDAWRAVAADGWLHAGLPQDDGTEHLPLPMVCGIGREAGKVLAGEGFVANAVLLPGLTGERDPDHFVPGFLVADGRRASLYGSASAATPWCFGVEPGLAAVVVEDSGDIGRWPSGAWDWVPTARLALGVGTVRPASAPETIPVNATTDHDELLRTARAVHAATLVGLGEQAWEDAVEYAGQRQQFGSLIGRFQSVKHLLADSAVALEIAWNAVIYAALRPDTVNTITAHLQAKRAADLAVRTAVQVFGGIAMTWEHSAHLFLKSAQAAKYRFGAPEDHALFLAGQLLREGAPR